MDKKTISDIEKRIGHHFENMTLLREAFTHSSYANFHENTNHNERLEFLGDSILGFIISENLFHRFPDEAEGSLSKIKAFMVHSDVLASITEKLGLHRYLLVDVNDSEIRHNQKLKENLLEAIIGAVYLDSGLDAARDMILRVFEQTGFLVTDPERAIFDHKTQLQEVFQALGFGLPEYVQVARRGPVHDAVFVVELRYNGRTLARGEGRSKKQAHQVCAELVLARTDNGRNLEVFLNETDTDILT